MNYSNRSAMVLCLALCLLLFGCSTQDGDSGKGPLTPWNGEWRSINSYLESPAMQDTYKAIADKTESGSADDVRKLLSSMHEVGFSALKISGDSLTFSGDDGSTSTLECKYSFEDKEVIGFGHDTVERSMLKTIDENCKEYGYIIITGIHKHHHEGLNDWHIRYGDKGFDDLMDNSAQLWWPALVPNDTQPGQVAEEILHDSEGLLHQLNSMNRPSEE